ncbi:hypothetical protein Cci01nite_36220 [Catellatospora citrea]|uniref:Uncharacterized protein n=1 Tax=Catellatospora citrea TaxID=53366 RepID=A0A8J3KGK7_9ACTN|nr:hypothetical protein Cci01nite_36220 [Catellatospora citrea]
MYVRDSVLIRNGYATGRVRLTATPGPRRALPCTAPVRTWTGAVSRLTGMAVDAEVRTPRVRRVNRSAGRSRLDGETPYLPGCGAFAVACPWPVPTGREGAYP